jgi:wobble nucleotide-excising tRNase
MSITKIKHIKNLAVFQDFDWDSFLRDEGNNIINFASINIFYGRNYSGKTTLSRLIRSLEIGNISDKYDNPEYTISFGNQDITQFNLIGHGKVIRVFNEDFIKDNLKFIGNSDDNIVPFAVLGGNASLEEEIKQLKSQLGEANDEEPTGFYLELSNARTIFKNSRDSYNASVTQLDNQLSHKATNRDVGIKYKPERFGDQNYNKAKLETDIRAVLDPAYQPISNDEQENLLKLLQEKTNILIPLKASPVFSFSGIADEAKDLITKPLSESGKIEELVKDSILNKWVKEGKALHENKRKDCGFCGNKISLDRWAELEKHFDEESEKLITNIDQLLNKINQEVTKVSNIFDIPKNLFYSKFHTRLDRIDINVSYLKSKYIGSLDNIKNQLELRKDDIINAKSFDLPMDYSKRLIWIFEIYESVKTSSNLYSSELSTDQNKAKTKLRLREVYDFAATIQYQSECDNIDKLKVELDSKEAIGKEITDKIESHKKLIEDNQRLMNDEEKGALKVNEYLNNYFGHDFLTLKAIEEVDTITSGKNIRFEIIRNRKKAHHLSEGECSLIAFCYFMARLEDITTKGLKPIIWIDDPISSLDSNHIFFIYSLINSEIVNKKDCDQLFISTHNLDFLKYLKRLPGALSKKEARYFIISREGDKSKIKVMPRYLKDYVTEFNYLFHQIYICAHTDIDDDNQHIVYYNFANNARKFLEAFLFYKYPTIEHDNKLLRFFGDNHQASSMTDRINNEYSHLEGIFERSMIPIDVPEMKKVATFVLNKIKEKDCDQYESLLKSIGVESIVIEQ